jgi:hypothetical protein
MALESYKQRKARIEQEQAPTVEEGLEDWDAPQECNCRSCEIGRASRRNEEKRPQMDRSDRRSVGEQV